MAKKKTTEKALNIDNILFNCRDYLRAARNSGSFFEKRDMMLTLVFLRFIGEKYEDGIENLKQTLKEQGLDPEDENIRAAFFDDATFADGTYNLPPEARWSTIISTPAPQLNVALDTALQRLEEEDPQLKGCFVKGTFTARNLAANDIKKIVDEVNKISHKTFGEEKDLIGRVYEYFLKEFAVNATKEEGEFYTPHDVVQLIATMIEPYDGTLYDPCCGSGGMFIQSAELVKSKQGNLNGINVYGQEKEPATYRLAKMNLALRGISHNLGEEADSSFTHDLHKGLHFNYIMANPPFNLKGWYNDNLKNDGRWSDYQTPPESNANYAWILHILSHLKKTDGVAGFLLANGALNDSDTLEIRKELIQNDKIEAIVVLPRELFITTDISVTLWILNQNKKGGKYHGRNLRNREHEILFMDLRQWTENAVKGESKKKVRLDTEQIEKAADIYHTWQCEGTDGAAYEMPELYRSVCINEIESKGWALTPSKYIEFIDHDLEIDYEKEDNKYISNKHTNNKEDKSNYFRKGVDIYDKLSDSWQLGQDDVLLNSENISPDRLVFNDIKSQTRYIDKTQVALVKSSHGCPYSCSFCYCRLLNNGIYLKPDYKRLISEIREIDSSYIWVIDDSFFVTREDALDFIVNAKNEYLNKSLIIYLRADFIVENEDLMSELKSWGIDEVIVGFESEDESMLSEYNKGQTANIYEKAVNILKKETIELTALFIVDPAYEIKDFLRLYKYIKQRIYRHVQTY